MAYLEVSAFKKLRAFFWALQKSSFNLNKIPTKDNEGTPVDKAYCLNLLRSFPDFQGEAFKDDNFLVKYLSKPGNLKQILDQFTPAQQIEVMKALEEKPAAVAVRGEQPSGGETLAEQGVPTQTPTDTATGTMGVPGLPSAASTSYAPRRVIIHNVPHAPESPPPKIAIANKSGVVKEAPPSKIYIADKSGRVVGEHAISPPAATAGPPVDTEATPLARGIRGGGTIKPPYQATNAAKNLGSSAQIGIKNFLGRVGRAGGGMLGGAIGGGGRALGRFGLRAVNFGANLSSAVSNRGSAFTAAGRGGARWAVVGLLGFFLLTGLLTAFAPSSPGSSPVGTSPIIVVDLNSCQLKRSDQNPQLATIKSSLLAGWFKEAESITSVPAQILAGVARLESPGFIASADNNHNALYGKNFTDLSASCAPHFGGAEGMSPTGALGLMQIQPPPTLIPKSVGYFENGVNFGAGFLGKTVAQLTIADFCDPRQSIIISAGFILKKLQLGYNIGDGTKWNPAWTNDKNVIDKVAEGFYGCLNYGGPLDAKCDDPRHIYSYGGDLWASIQSCKITQILASCPIAGGQIKTPSYQASPEKGHCSPSYGSCPADSRKAKAIDVDTQGGDVLFPTINGQNVSWKYITDLALDKPGNCEGGVTNCGRFYVFRADVGSEWWMLHLLHLDPNNISFNKTDTGNPSGSKAGKTVPGIYLHTEIGKNIVNYQAPPLGSQDLDAGWISADFMCK